MTRPSRPTSTTWIVRISYMTTPSNKFKLVNFRLLLSTKLTPYPKKLNFFYIAEANRIRDTHCLFDENRIFRVGLESLAPLFLKFTNTHQNICNI